MKNEHEITYTNRDGHRRRFAWSCSCGVGAAERTRTASFRAVADHLGRTRSLNRTAHVPIV